jgi:uridine kinase
MWPGVLEGEDKYIRIFKPFADYVLDTSFSYEIQCLAPRVQALAAEFCDGSAATQPLEKLAQTFALCDTPLETLLPEDSMLREFLG